MSFNDGNTTMTMPVAPAGYGGALGNGWGDGSLVWLILFFALFSGGWGNGGGNGYDTRADLFANAELSRCNQQSAFMQQLFNMQMADQQCGCETQRLIERGFCDANYNFTTQACDTRNTIQTSTRDIIENQNANSRAILDFLTQDKLSTLQAENQTLKLAASQANQNAVIGARIDASTAEVLRRVAPLPVPSYPVPNPYTGQYGYGYNGGCGCNPCCA